MLAKSLDSFGTSLAVNFIKICEANIFMNGNTFSLDPEK